MMLEAGYFGGRDHLGTGIFHSIPLLSHGIWRSVKLHLPRKSILLFAVGWLGFLKGFSTKVHGRKVHQVLLCIKWTLPPEVSSSQEGPGNWEDVHWVSLKEAPWNPCFLRQQCLVLLKRILGYTHLWCDSDFIFLIWPQFYFWYKLSDFLSGS